jgi:hypothetical protein
MVMVQTTISGKLLGLDDENVCVVNGADDVRRWEDIKRLKLLGRYLYVKKCRRASDVNGIAIPEKSRGQTNVCVVLAVGLGCGEFHTLTEEEESLNDNLDNSLFEIVERTPGDIKVGDKIFFPNEDPYGAQKGISRMPYGKDEFLIHECLAIGAIED